MQSQTLSVNLETNQVSELTEGLVDEPVDSNLILTSKNNDRTIRILKDAKNEKELYLELWDKSGYVETLKLPDVSLIYNDTVFGGISWSKDGTKIAFISEKPEVKAFKPYWSAEAITTDPEKLKEEAKMTSIGDKYNYEANFGETLVNKKLPVLTIYDLEKKDLSRIDLTSVNSDLFKDSYPACPIFDESGNGLVFHAYFLPNAKLGLNFCHN